MPRRSVLRVHSILLEMIRQDFSPPIKQEKLKPMGKRTETGHVWEVRHAGLLGIKYEVAVRKDLVETPAADVTEQSVQESKEVLRGIVDATVLGYV